MCKWEAVTLVNVKIMATHSCSGEEYWKEMKIDSCIAPLVDALQRYGVDMHGSCCGHGKERGRIDLVDGQIIWLPQLTVEKREC